MVVSLGIICTIKDRDGMDLQTQKRLGRGGKSTQKSCKKKVLMSQITTIMWSLTWSQTSWTVKSSGPYGSSILNKVNDGDGILADLFKILKDNAVKVLCSLCQQIQKTPQLPVTGKGQFSLHSQRKTLPKNVQTTIQLHSFLIVARLCSKSFKLGLHST